MKLKLNNDLRNQIVALAATVIDCPAEHAAEREAGVRLLALLRTETAVRFPEADLAVLRRHGFTRKVNHAGLATDAGYLRFCFCPRDYTQPDRWSGCHRGPDNCDVWLEIAGTHGDGWDMREKDVGAKLQAAFRAFDDAKRAHDTARELILRDVRSLVTSSRRFDQVAAAWPVVERFADRLGAVRVASGDTAARLAAVAVVP